MKNNILIVIGLLGLTFFTSCSENESKASVEDVDLSAPPEIVIGLISDLSGPFAQVSPIMVGIQQAYFENINAQGGIGSVPVTLKVYDSGYDPVASKNHYETLRDVDNVLAISHAMGTPHFEFLKDNVEDKIAVIPTSWPYIWTSEDPNLDFSNVFEFGGSYAFSAANGVAYLNDYLKNIENTESPITKITFVGFLGDYSGGSLKGVKYAANSLGIQLDEFMISPMDDFNSFLPDILASASNSELVFVSTGPTQTAQLLGALVTNNQMPWVLSAFPAYNPAFLNLPFANYIEQKFFALSFSNDLDNLADDHPLKIALTGNPDTIEDDCPPQALMFCVTGWIQAKIMHEALKTAADNNQLNREGVVSALSSITISFEGLMPDHRWNGERESYGIKSVYLLQPDRNEADLTKFISGPLLHPAVANMKYTDLE